MQIIAGKYGGHRLHTLPGAATRPAMGRTREALFSMLEARGMAWTGCRVLDLFAGCGSLGLEALSRGAEEIIFVDNSAAACRCISRNIAALSAEPFCRVLEKNALRFSGSFPEVGFDMVFIDPPYRNNFLNPSLKTILSHNLLRDGAFVSAEIENTAPIPEWDNLDLLTGRVFGQTKVLIWQKNGAACEDSTLSRDL